MTIKNVLVYTDNDQGCGNRILSAVNICQHFEAYLTGMYATRMLNVHPYPYTYLPNSAFEILGSQARKLCEEVRTEFTKKLFGGNVQNEFHDFEGDVVGNINQESRYADLLIIPRGHVPGTDVNPNYLTSDVLLGAACPVLLLPDSHSPMMFPLERVLIAWDGGHECARALNSALPLLTKVKTIDVVSVSSDDTQVRKIARHIERYGKEVNVHLASGSNFDAGGALLNQAESLNSQLMVMGAFGHSRLREQLLGGATQHVIDHSNLPVLFSH